MTTPSPLIGLPALAVEMGISAPYLRDFMIELTPESQRPGKGHRWTFDRATADVIHELYCTTRSKLHCQQHTTEG